MSSSCEPRMRLWTPSSSVLDKLASAWLLLSTVSYRRECGCRCRCGCECECGCELLTLLTGWRVVETVNPCICVRALPDISMAGIVPNQTRRNIVRLISEMDTFYHTGTSRLVSSRLVSPRLVSYRLKIIVVWRRATLYVFISIIMG